MTTSTPRLRTHLLDKTFGEGPTVVHAVRDLKLQVEPGEIILLMGSSGSGKTTLLTMLGGLLRPTSGEVWIDDVDIAALADRHLPPFRATTFGFIFQDFNLLSALTARENVEIALNIAGIEGTAAHERTRELFQLLDLEHRADFPIEALSGGERQRVAIARALTNHPRVILADEPTANLDSANGAVTMRLLRTLAHDDHTSVVIASHDNRLREIADRVLWLEDGSLRQLADMRLDPNCGMQVDPANAIHASLDDVDSYFCSAGCRDEYAKRDRVASTDMA